MNIKPSMALRNEYAKISSLAHKSREPIFITKNGEGDLVVQSLEVYEERERLMKEREDILETEYSRLAGDTPLSVSDMRERLREKYLHGSTNYPSQL
jgi:prevent-host-death family protein